MFLLAAAAIFRSCWSATTSAAEIDDRLPLRKSQDWRSGYDYNRINHCTDQSHSSWKPSCLSSSNVPLAKKRSPFPKRLRESSVVALIAVK